ncbi:MAG TPA: rhomboid family intramembrane serine protease [Micromonosporaceae bacterium]
MSTDDRWAYDGPPRFGTDEFYASLGRAFVAMCAVVPVLFAIEVLDTATGQRLDALGGVRPHHLDGLDGVLLAPFLHDGFDHLYANSVPLILLGTFVLASGARQFLGATVVIMLVSGFGVWFTGSADSVVIGASGVLFGYLALLLVRGVIERRWWNLGVGLLIALLYGWQILGILPRDPAFSWQAHLFGLLGGVLAALIFRVPRPRRPAEAILTEAAAHSGAPATATDPARD